MHTTITLEIRGDGTHRARQRRNRVMFKRISSLVFQPLDSMIGPDQRWRIEGIAIGIQHVKIAVAIKIHELNTTAAVGRMGRGIYSFLAKRTFTLVQESHDRLMFLANERDKIKLAVLV